MRLTAGTTGINANIASTRENGRILMNVTVSVMMKIRLGVSQS